MLNRFGATGTRRSFSFPGHDAVPAARGAAVEPLEGRLLLATHLTPVADTFVRNNAFQDVNYGASPFLWVKTSTPGGGDSRNAFLRFNVGGIDASSIGTATLYLAGALQAPNTPPITAGVFGVADDSWQEGNGTVSVRRRGAGGGGGSQLTGTSLGDGFDVAGGMDWNNQPATSAGPIATAVVDRDTFNTYAFDVTQYVKSQVSNNNSVSLAVKGNEATTAFMRFISSNFEGPGKPQLVISRGGDDFVRANITAPGISRGGGATHTVVVSYAGGVPVDLSKFGTDDIVVRRADGAALDVVNLSADQPFNSASVNVTYVIALPGGTADRSDNGVYTIELPRGQARDVSGNENAASFGSFRIAIDDNQGPSAAVVAGPVTAPGGNSYTFTVNYADDVAIDAESVNINNVAVTGPGNVSLPVTQVTLSPDGDAGQIAATYTVLAPGGEWDATDNGAYSIVPRNTQVRDTAGHDVSEGLGTFQVDIGPPDDQSPQVTSVAAPNVTAAGGTSHSVTVIYSDNVAIDVGSIDAADITVGGPRGNLAVGAPQVSQPTDGSPRTVTYPLTPPDGSWDAADNGTYTITVNGGAVRDTSGLAVAAATGSFDVNATGTDSTAPSATVSAAPDVTAAGAATYSFTVVYGDDVAVRANSLDAGDVTVTVPGGGQLQVVGVAPSPNNDASQVAVTYTVAARGGSWDAGDNGAYGIILNGNQVADTSGNVIGGPVQIGVFQVAVPSADNQRPGATINALNVTSGGAGTYSFTVTYTDNVGINAGTVGPDDVAVTGPSGPLTVTATQTLAAGTDLVVTYVVTPPGNSWDASDNGAYTITVGDNAVADASGNGVAGRSQAFHVNVNGGDQFGPQGTISAPNVAAPGETVTVTVKWQDDSAVRSNTIDVNDIIVTRGDANGPRLRVISADVTPKNNGPSLTAVYTVEAFGGAWDPSDNGTYTVTLVPEEVRDTADGGHAAQAGSATFSVGIADSASPTATIAAPNIVESTGERQKITVAYNDDIAVDITSIQGSTDLVITGPDGVTQLVPVSVTTSSSTNAPTIVVTYEIDPPGGTWDVSDAGVYTVSVRPGSVKDAAGNAVTGSGTFSVILADQTPPPGFPVNAGFTIEAMAAQEDGKVVLVGRQASPNLPAGNFQSVVQRRNVDGTLDTGFGNGGQVLGDPSSNVVFYAVVLTNNGIVAAGSQDGHWVLARYSMLGQPDVTFGQNGRTVATFNANNEAAYALAVDPRDGKLVAGGGSPAGPDDGEADQNFAFARFSPGGVLDPTFGQSGLQLFDINGEDVVGAITVRDDGRVVAAGSSGTNISLFQLGTNGEPDATFSTDGYFTVQGLKARGDTGFFADHSQALAIQDGKILVGNHTDAGDFGIARVNPDGTIDPSFGQDGIATIDIGGNNDDVDSLVLQPTGEILAVGTSNSGPGGAPVTAVAALDRSGNLLTGWNAGGKLTFEPSIIPAAGRELHIGDLILRAFGTRQSDGRLVVGSSDRSPAPTSSNYRKILVPGVTAQPIGEALGVFGVGSTNRGKKFVYTDADGTVITFSLKGNATGRVYLSGDKLNLRIEDLSGGSVPCSVVIKARGGDGRIKIGDVICTGGLKAFNARTADLSGTMYVPGMAGKLALGNLTGTVAASGAITSLLVAGLDGAKVLSGANLGSDAKLGGTSTSADTFGQGFIGALKVAGRIKGSTVAAGLNPVDETIGDEDDIVVGGVGAPGGPFSVIRTITAKGGADDTSQFIAGGFKSVRLPKRIDPANDAQGRFRVK